ncbi:MAG: bifunctional DNA primase/polymerase [Ferrovibrio sp.]|uniref:bifunctional DNA primase/polymerase n=1 Tax=Ferrovibrio sp. TaxID=1917215 RepID=UPI00261DF8F0|nr:bifunctional DNA primase/polymerase [Ferrovibrio sp.]MCW0235262.1 bifunctional DNA primase/polymerase [Ferrovibrio sp.]
MTPHELAISYAEMGWPCFPCRSAPEEVTDTSTGEVILAKEKTPNTPNGFKGATTSRRILDIWFLERYPCAMVGIPTGEKIGAWVLDVDVDPDKGIDGYKTLAALEAEHAPLPDTRRVRTPRGGTHHYFKYTGPVRNRGALGAGLDIRGNGGFCISAGSVMADGRSYEWINPDAPILDAPQWLLDIVVRKPAPAVAAQPHVGPYANDAYVEAAIDRILSELSSEPPGNRNNALNDAAFAVGTFVGAGAIQESSARGWLEDIARQWPNFPKSNGTISNGLKAGILQPRSIPEPRAARDEGTPELDAALIVQNTLAKIRERNLATIAEERAIDTPRPPAKLDIEPLEAFTRPGGLIEDMVDWIVSSSESPCRPLALAGVLPLLAALMGSRYSTGTRDTRPNIYTVALAGSGFGKDHARSQIKRLFMPEVSHDVFALYGGPARIMSASALRESLEKHNSIICQIDEFGGFIRNITDRRAGSHQQAISADLRDYYSASATYFEGAAYRGAPAKKIYNPVLCLHGTSTPEQFWSALSSASAEDGLLPRFLLFHVTDKPKPAAPAREVVDVPTFILERMALLAGIDVASKRGLGRVMADAGQVPHKVIRIPWDDAATAAFERLRLQLEEAENTVSAEVQPFVRRVAENTVKLAMIAAAGTNPGQPCITGRMMDWAGRLAWTCASTMISQGEQYLSDTLREANYKRIGAIVKRAGKAGIPRGKLIQSLRGVDTRQREEIIKDMVEAGTLLEEVKMPGPKGGRPTKMLFWVDEIMDRAA